MNMRDTAMMAPSRSAFQAYRKSRRVAYLLWLLTGVVGGHRFYFGHKVSGALQASSFLLGLVTLPIFIGALPLAALAIWLIGDLFLIPGMARDHNEELAEALTGGADPALRDLRPARVLR